jgi:hypothetical protein
LLADPLKQIRKNYLQTGGISEIVATPPLGLLYFYLDSHHDNHIVNLLALNRVLMIIRQVK